ncbi:hypothetical protein [Humibacter antri]
MPEFNAIELLRTLETRGVEYVLIGGYAAVQHGSPFLTQDVDITPEASQENLARLSDALRDLHALVRTASEPDGLPFAHDAASLASAQTWNLVTDFGDFDISFVPNGTTGYADLARDASLLDVRGVTVRLASLADIIRSKQATNRPKDQRVLPTLREILASRHEPG